MKSFSTIAIFSLSLLLQLNLFAQGNNKESRKDIMSKLIAEKKDYLKEKIPLSDKEAEEFFTIYDEMEVKKFNIAHSTFKESDKIARSEEPISDETYLKSAEDQALIPVKMSEIEQEYFKKFKKILTPKQLFMFYRWEHRFGKAMIKREQKKVNFVK